MVDITNGINSITVTKGAFEGIYKHQGYTLVHDYAVSTTLTQAETEVSAERDYIPEDSDVANVNVEEPEASEKSLEKSDMLEKPIGQWSKEELKEFAEANGISLEGAKSVKEVKEIIKDYINSVE